MEERWKRCDYYGDSALLALSVPHYVMLNLEFSFYRQTEAEAWHAAFLYTVKQEHQIAEVEKEILWINSVIYGREHLCAPETSRILAREQRALNDLLRGFKYIQEEPK